MNIEERLRLLEQRVEQLEKLLPAKQQRKRRLPDDWQPDEDLIAWAKEAHPNVELSIETDKFRDYWHGTGTAKLDWSATYRNWIRRAAQFSKTPVQSLHGQSPSRVADAAARNRQRGAGALDLLAKIQPRSTG